MIAQEHLDELWTFSDPAASELRLRAAVDAASTEHERLELVTQVARSLGLQGRITEARCALDRVESELAAAVAADPSLTSGGSSTSGGSVTSGGSSPTGAAPVASQGEAATPTALSARAPRPTLWAVVDVRLALERGRLLNSSGKPAEAVPFFSRARSLAQDAGLLFLEVDALHMLAIADVERSGEWAQRGIHAASQAPDARTKRWLVGLHNNLGWTHFDAADVPAAAQQFRLALHWADAVGTAEQRTYALEALAECENALAHQR